MNKKSSTILIKNAEEINRLHKSIHSAFKEKTHGPEHSKACAVFHENYDRLAFPGGLAQAMHLLKEHDSVTIATAIKFLEIDPMFHRSGYIKEDILRYLKKAQLSKSQIETLERLIIRSIYQGGRREFNSYAKLAGALHTKTVLRTIKKRLSGNREQIRRAEKMMQMIKSRIKEDIKEKKNV
jgi:hypothetical protein